MESTVFCVPWCIFAEYTVFCIENGLRKSCVPCLSLIYYYITLTGTANLGVSLRCGRMQRGCLRYLVILEFYGGPGLRAFISADVVACVHVMRTDVSFSLGCQLYLPQEAKRYPVCRV